jgi:signal transduction histidine kinase/DNA-binding LacI/PurR family transcriptional regulator/AraC-like DNA-binding protein/FixJ family two-component response regulator
MFSPLEMSPNNNPRPTIAFFGGLPGGAYAYEKWHMWRGGSEAATELNVNLLYIAGDVSERSPNAILYQLVDAQTVHGLVVWHSFVSAHSLEERVREFLAPYAPLPVVNIEMMVEGYPSLLLDELQGMHDLLAHLVEVHGYRRIAFYNMPDAFTSVRRHQAFEWVMRGYGFYDANLVGTLDQLDARGLRPGLDYQAIITHADPVALEVMQNFQARGLHVPEDVAVTGYNDGNEARGAIPVLTTLRLPFRQMGRRAIEMVVAKITGNEFSSSQVMPLRLITRRSCGCLDPLAEQAAVGVVLHLQGDLASALAVGQPGLLQKMARGLGSSAENRASLWAEGILNCFLAGLHDPLAAEDRRELAPETFLYELNRILYEAVAEGLNVNRWHEAISILRGWCLPYLSGYELTRAEDLWQQARVLIAQTAARTEVHRAWQTSQRAAALREIESALLITFDLDEMMNILADGLPRLGIRGCYLSLYEDPEAPQSWANLVLVYRDGERKKLDAGLARFPSRQIVPQSWLPADRRYSLVVIALNFRQEQIGFVAFETDVSNEVVETAMFVDSLQVILGAAIKGVRLRQQLQEATRQAEEANKLKSRFLSMVSHELRTPLNLIVGLSELALREQARGEKASIATIHRYQEQIYNSGRHLDRLIRDVLDLASSQVGQMNLLYDWVDLVEVLHDVAGMGRQLADQKNLSFLVDIPEKLPAIWGDKTRLRQILLNLISNAIKFTAHGEVALSACPNANEVLIAVRDTGLGISPDEQEKIFDEFKQSERTSARGYGGIGLGLAITSRLVEMHGGGIWVRSSGEEGRGSTFYFTLPIPEHLSDEDVRLDVSRVNKVLILTQEDGGAHQLMAHLAHQGFLVEELALNQEPEYMAQLLEAPPGAIVLDMAPAAEQGWEIMRILKGHLATQDIPVLFYSLMAEQNSGAVLEMEVLTKPLGTDELVRALERHGLKSTRGNGNYTILLADDDPGILAIHADLIRTEFPNSAILVAHNGLDALRLMGETQPDLLLLDLMMPELDGFGVIRALQEDQRLRSIPIIVLSAHELTQQDMATLNKSVAAVLGKGLFSTQETLVQIEGVLARNKRLGSEPQRLVRQAMAYIHEHYADAISRVDIAGFLSINEQYLTRCFNKELAISPIVYLNRYRIRQAKWLLERGQLSITQIALEVGFSSQSYFSRMFQREVGVTPKAYQRGERSKDE